MDCARRGRRIDLSAFYGAYRVDGHGRPAYEPSMMVGLLLYAYARGNRSSRGIERARVEDVACRVVAGNRAPDRSTIAEFRCRHERPWARCSPVCWGCALERAWRRRGGGDRRDEDLRQRVEQREPRFRLSSPARSSAEAAETDRARGRALWQQRGDGLPEHLRTREGGAGRCARPRSAWSAKDSSRRAARMRSARWRSSSIRSQFVTRPQGRRRLGARGPSGAGR